MSSILGSSLTVSLDPRDLLGLRTLGSQEIPAPFGQMKHRIHFCPKRAARAVSESS